MRSASGLSDYALDSAGARLIAKLRVSWHLANSQETAFDLTMRLEASRVKKSATAGVIQAREFNQGWGC